MTAKVDNILQRLSVSLGDRLASVYQFGSSFARGPRAPDVRLLVLVDQVDAGLLDAVRDTHQAAVGSKIFLRLDTARDVLKSADVLPLFALELVATRQLLHGSDVLSELTVQSEHLVLRLEQSLRGAHRDLVRGYLAAEGNPDISRNLRSQVRKTIGLLRGLIQVCQLNPSVPATPSVLIETVIGHLCPEDLAVWHRLIRFADFLERLETPELLNLYTEALAASARLVEAVDRLA